MFAVMSMMLCFCITDMPSFQQCCTVYADDDYKPDGLTVGDSGDSVKWIQESLNIINNAGLEENGIFDDKNAILAATMAEIGCFSPIFKGVKASCAMRRFFFRWCLRPPLSRLHFALFCIYMPAVWSILAKF